MVRLLHTSDWHVGKTLRGRSRADEHRDVLAEIAAVAADEAVDATVVVGDLFDTAAPTPEAEAIVYEALLALAEQAPVVVVGGNHDNPRRLTAVAPLLRLGRVHVVPDVRRPDDGGVHDLEVGGGTVRFALVPFVSKRGIVRAEHLMAEEAFETQQRYDERLRAVVEAMCTPFAADTANVVCAHAFVAGGRLGGGERDAHTVLDYALGALAFPATAQYVALGHLHRAQDVPGATRIRYSGSPLQLDFGEDRDAKSVTVVDVEPGVPSRVREVPLRSGRRLRTLRSSLGELEAAAGSTGEDLLRVIVTDRRRAGLAEQVRAWHPHAVDVLVEAPEDDADGSARRPRRAGASPRELFAAFLEDRGVEDARLVPAFDALLDEVGAGSDA